MAATTTPRSTLSYLIITTLSLFSLLSTPATSSLDTFVFGGCSQLKYAPGSPYESNVNSLLTSLVNSATFTTYNNLTLQSQDPASPAPLSGLFQCRGDLDNADCARCVARAVSQLGSLCLNAAGGALQLDGCFVKYDNATFLGVEDKSEVLKKCGPTTIGYDSDALARRDSVLGFLESGSGDGGAYGKPYRVSSSGDASGVAQCVQDLSASECQDCLSDAIGRLKSYCGTSAAGDMFLAKCYARFSVGGGATSHAGNGNNNNNDDEIEKTLAILIGLIAGVALIIVFLSFLGKVCSKGKGGK